MNRYSYLKSQNAEYIEELFQRYLQDPNSIDESWQYFFEGMELNQASDEDQGEANGHVHTNGNGHGAAQGVIKTNGSATTYAAPAITPVTALPSSQVLSSEAKVAELIQSYREVGIMLANINPLEKPKTELPLLSLSIFQLTDADLDRKFTAAKFLGFKEAATLREIIAHLRETYCSSIGVEFTHIMNLEQRDWLRTRMESARNKAVLSRDAKKRILQKLTEAECFERFLHTRYVAQKRFSVEGGDALIPMLDTMADVASESGAVDMVVGMAHRGRLNVLTNIFGKKYEHIFSEFEGAYKPNVVAGEGDVKYHMGYSSDFNTFGGKTIHMSLAFNPSHLEFVSPVVQGSSRAKLRLKTEDGNVSKVFNQVVPVTIHGDAAFAGQGIVYETIQLCGLKAYRSGGTIRIVVNNQVGFTTLPQDSRSTRFSTDMAKMLETPIFHVNGDDAEAVYYVSRLAMEFRQKFHHDVVIDLVCYRKYGHNEGDEPSFTQPTMYKQIKDHPSPREVYSKKLVSEGVLTQQESDQMVEACNEKLAASQAIAKSNKEPANVSVFEGQWKGLRRATEEDFKQPTDTTVSASTLKEIGKKLCEVPSGFTVHPKLTRLLEGRLKMIESGSGIDWGMGEALAFGSLVYEGSHVRITGQDAERGTFSHRHSVLYDFNTGAKHTPLNHLKSGQAEYLVANSPLSEAAVLGFEFGHAIADPKALTIWEAQFGDFANGAQVIIDQFISSCESKWSRMLGLILLLPHGYEGQGPEHSSARLERFLQMCAKLNFQVCNFTTPAQVFHGFRRQLKREFRKPLIVMTPKSLLRHPEAISTLNELSTGSFKEVIDDPTSPVKAKRVLFCSGKVYYDLAASRTALNKDDVAIVRVEQLYPWPDHLIKTIVEKYKNASQYYWVQEEPKNMGAWQFVRDYLANALGTKPLQYVGRAPAAAPAVGSSKVHEQEQKTLVAEALA